MLTRKELEAKQRKEKTKKRKEALARHRKLNKGPPPSESQVVFFAAALKRTPLPPPLPLHIRFVIPAPTVNMLFSWHDRTVSEWLQCIEAWNKMSWFTKAEGDAIKEQLRYVVFQNFRVRWQLRKWILRHRLAETHRRNTDLTDVCTTLPIPTKACVTVFDLPTRKAYYFHYQTIQTLVVNSLLFQQYGIPNPLYPKNPYTNVPWTYCQLVSITQQIGERVAYHGRVPNLHLQEFRMASYCLRPFAKKNRRVLAVQAALTFFQKKYDQDVKEIYFETLEDMYNEYFELRTPLFGRNAVIDLITHEALPKEQQNKWDNLVVCFWIYENHRILLSPYTEFNDLLDEFGKLHNISYRQEREHNRLALLIFTAALPPSLPFVAPGRQDSSLSPSRRRATASATTATSATTSVEHA